MRGNLSDQSTGQRNSYSPHIRCLIIPRGQEDSSNLHRLPAELKWLPTPPSARPPALQLKCGCSPLMKGVTNTCGQACSSRSSQHLEEHFRLGGFKGILSNEQAAVLTWAPASERAGVIC